MRPVRTFNKLKLSMLFKLILGSFAFALSARGAEVSTKNPFEPANFSKEDAHFGKAFSSPKRDALVKCIYDHEDAKGLQGLHASLHMTEVPGKSIVVNPFYVGNYEFDVDTWTSVAREFSWATFRDLPVDENGNSSGVASEILNEARKKGKMIRLTKLDGVKSCCGFSWEYDNALKIEMTEQTIDPNADPVEAMLSACLEVK